MNDTPVVTVVGSTMVDMVTYLNRLPTRGETIHGRDFMLGFGGKGANQAVMAALLGAQVSMVNCVGEDAFGDLTLKNLDDYGIDRRCVTQIDGASSGAAAIWVEPGGDNRIVIAPGANSHITRQHIDRAFDMLDPPDIVLCQLEIPQEAVFWSFERAKKLGATTVLSPAPAAALDARVLARTDWLIPNQTEFALIVHDVLGSRPADSEFSDAMRALSGQLDANLVVTMGEKGALLYESHGQSGVQEVAGVEAEAIDTTGAGDAFVGAFSYAVGMERPPQEAVQLACACASASVTRKGTQTSFPRGPELQQIRMQALVPQ